MTNGSIHPTAIIDPKAEIDPSVEIGPYAVIEADVSIGRGTKIGPYVHIQGIAEIGEDNFIGTGAQVGHAPQHGAYSGEPRLTRIGDRNQIREYVSIHRAYEEGSATTVGNDCLLMGMAHVGHDCVLGDSVVISNFTGLAGHVTVGDRVFMAGSGGVHQFCRIGRLAFVGAMAKVRNDIPPFVMADGDPVAIRALNSVGLKRAPLSTDGGKDLRRLFKQLYRSNRPIRSVIEELDSSALSPEGRELVEFYAGSVRGVIPPAGVRGRADAKA